MAKSKVAIVTIALAVSAGCSKDMALQPKFLPEGKTSFFSDQRTTRPQVEHTIALDQSDSDSPIETGLSNGKPLSQAPISVTLETLKLGRSRYTIYCTPCHDQLGLGNGLVVQRGFQKPESLSSEDVNRLSDGDLFRAISFGYRNMAGYEHVTTAQERWAITAYVRALSLSQNFPSSSLEPDDLKALQRQGEGP